MKLFYEYMSHDNEDNWVIYKDEKIPEQPQNAVSPTTGNEAITCQKQYPSDYCFISFIPAARGENIDTMYHSEKNNFFIAVYNRTETEYMVSKHSYSWEDASRIAKSFVAVPFDSGKRIWKAKKI
jgi:hypothetical protein